MSTRCAISCVDSTSIFSLYRHCDGYPDSEHGVLASIAAAFPISWPRGRFEANEFAASLIAAWKDAPGNIRLSPGAGAHGDIEFYYEIRGHKSGVAVTWWSYDQYGQRNVEPHKVIIVNPWKGSAPPVRRVLELSTGHLTPGTRFTLSEWAESQAFNLSASEDQKEDYLAPFTLAAFDSGWHVSGWLDEYESDADYPADLKACIAYAKLANCTGIMFDRDVVPIDGLPDYEDS